MENLKDLLRARLEDGSTIDELCAEFTDAINELNDKQFQYEIMEPLLDLLDEYYAFRHPEKYAKAFPDGLSQEAVESTLDTLLEIGGALQKLDALVVEKNLDPEKVAQELARRIFA